MASDFDSEATSPLSSGGARAFKPETQCADSDRAHRIDRRGVFGYGAMQMDS